MFRAALLLACCIALSSSASAQQQQFAEWQFQIPPGWQFSAQGDHALLSPTAVAPGVVYIKLFPGQPFTGSLETWLGAQVSRDSQGVQVIQSSPVVPVKNRPSALQKVIATQSGNGRRAVRMYIGESPSPGRVELFLFYGELPTARDYTAAMGTFSNSVHFSTATAGSNTMQSETTQQPVTSQPVPAETANSSCPSLCSGWWVRSMPRPVSGPNFTFTMRPHWEYYRFFPNGWVYTSLPASGDMDSIACPQAGVGEDKCERYTQQGNSIAIGQDKAKTVEWVSTNEFRYSGVPAWRLRPLAAPLSGTYEAVSGSGSLGTVALSISELTFYPNGTFSTSRTSSVNSTTSASSASAYRNSGGAGRYTINGYDLQLSYSNGQTVNSKILAPSDNDADLLVIGSRTYIKKSAKR